MDERVQVFDFVLVFRGVVVDSGHAASFWGAENADLGAMDIVVETSRKLDYSMAYIGVEETHHRGQLQRHRQADAQRGPSSCEARRSHQDPGGCCRDDALPVKLQVNF